MSFFGKFKTGAVSWNLLCPAFDCSEPRGSHTNFTSGELTSEPPTDTEHFDRTTTRKERP